MKKVGSSSPLALSILRLSISVVCEFTKGGLDLLLFAGLIAAWFSCELVVVFSKLLEVIFGVALPYSLD